MAVLTPTPPLSTEAQQLQLLSQIQSEQLPVFDAIILGILLKIPLPESIFSTQARLDMYQSITGSSSLSAASDAHPLFFIFSFLFWPVWIMLGLTILYFLIKFILSFSQTTFPNVFARFLPETPKTFLELTFPSDTSKSAYATEQLYKLLHTLSRRKSGIFAPKTSYSLEIVATRENGIRYVLVVPSTDASVIQKSLLSYLPGLHVKEVPDYLSTIRLINESSDSSENSESQVSPKTLGVVEYTLSADYALPLHDQKALKEHDPMSFLTAHMTKLLPGELISYQIITSPHLSGKVQDKMQMIRNAIYSGKPLSPILQKKRGLPLPAILLFIFSPTLFVFVAAVKFLFVLPYLLFAPNSPESKGFFGSSQKVPLQTLLNPYEQELANTVKDKLSQQLFDSTLRIFIVTNDNEEFDQRENGLTSSFGQFSSAYQSLTPKDITQLPFFSSRALSNRILNFKRRTLSESNTILSSSELSDLYHFPNMDLARIEGLVKSKSHELPAPLSLKKDSTNLDVIVGMNTYGGEETPVGLSSKDRQQHTYIVGKTGMGKSTTLEGMALQDIQNGKGVCVIDPHGDMVEHLLSVIPQNRVNDIVYVNPFDKDYPIGLNILSPGIDYIDNDETVDRIATEVLHIFMKITPEKHWGQRMEHILRNATLTALQIPQGTPETPYVSLYTIQKLLTDNNYRKAVTKTVQDPILKQFWEKEFKLFGTRQQADVISPITNKLGEFITNKMSRNILLQKKSTINISEIMNEEKILLVNLSKGNLGEERSIFFGTIITSLIQLAIYQRAQIPEKKRRDFFVYIDEFQNFATSHFTDLFSEARKYHVFFIPSHQNIAQIDDLKVAKIIQGNSGTLIALKGSPDDEKVLLPFLSPEVEKGQIVNLPPHHFFMKVTNDESEDAFTGVTIPINDKGNELRKERIINYSRGDYATPKETVENDLADLFVLPKLPSKTNGKKQTKAIRTTKVTSKNDIKTNTQYQKQQVI